MRRRIAVKLALATGATNGIGQPVAIRLATEGAVVGVKRRPIGDPTGRLDSLVSKPASNPPVTWAATNIELWNELSETDLRGTRVVTTEAAKQMARKGHDGAIACVSSKSAHVRAPGQAAYSATKGGMSMQSRALGAVPGGHNIRVDTVESMALDTSLAALHLDDSIALRYYEELIALHRIDRPEELARGVVFLLNADAGCVTSATFIVDGGLIVKAEL